jgi:hypothetical protein
MNTRYNIEENEQTEANDDQKDNWYLILVADRTTTYRAPSSIALIWTFYLKVDFVVVAKKQPILIGILNCLHLSSSSMQWITIFFMSGLEILSCWSLFPTRYTNHFKC